MISLKSRGSEIKWKKRKGGGRKKEGKWATLVGAELLPSIWKMPKGKMSRSQLKIYYFITRTFELVTKMAEISNVKERGYYFEIFHNVEKTIRIVAIKIIIIRNVDKVNKICINGLINIDKLLESYDNNYPIIYWNNLKDKNYLYFRTKIPFIPPSNSNIIFLTSQIQHRNRLISKKKKKNKKILDKIIE